MDKNDVADIIQQLQGYRTKINERADELTYTVQSYDRYYDIHKSVRITPSSLVSELNFTIDEIAMWKTISKNY